MRLLGGKRNKTAEPKKAKATGTFLAGRGIAIAVLALVSGASFALGFFVGKSTTSAQVVTEVITVAAEPDATPVQYGTGLPIAPTDTNGKESSSSQEEAAATSGTGATYTVQIGAFARNEDARDMRARFRNKGYPAYILEAETAEKKPIYRVRVGRYNNKSDAIRMALKLKRHEGATSFVTASK